MVIKHLENSVPVHMKKIKNVSGGRFLKNDLFKLHVLSVSTIIIQCTVSLQNPVESLPMFYRAVKQKIPE